MSKNECNYCNQQTLWRMNYKDEVVKGECPLCTRLEIHASNNEEESKKSKEKIIKKILKEIGE